MSERTLLDIIMLYIEKVFENLASVKVWFFLIPFLGSSYMLWYICTSHMGFVAAGLTAIAAKPELVAGILGSMKIITEAFMAWCTFNATLVGSIIVVREIYKVRRLNSINESDTQEKVDKIKKVNV